MPVAPALGRLATHAWTGDTAAARVLRATLVPAAAAYAAAVRLRNLAYDHGWLPSTRVPARVVSVGNLAVGGTGKTPAALWLAEAFQRRGRRPAIVARGYGKRRPGVVVVGRSGTPLVSPAEGGDEAVLLARRFTGPVVTAERRADAAHVACAALGADTIVLDDGFQHRALARDADLVLLAPGAATGLLPAGPLREPPAALARADAVLLIGEGIAHTPPGLPAFHGRLEPTAVVVPTEPAWTTAPLASLAGRRVLAAAGIAHPDRLAASLRAAGADVVRLVPFPDHHTWTTRDVGALRRAAADALVVTTEKDLVKLAHLPGTDTIRALRVSLVVDDPDRLVDLLLGLP
jgi:tetraacyldisaccharide 4'-kinase